jgi:uncharacterized protein (DUF3084 family)
MSTSPPTAASKLISKSEFLSSLPPWRRFLAKLNWHPTVDAQLSAIEARIESERLRNETAQLRSESEQVKSETEQVKSETERVKSETEQLRRETEQLKIENARLAKLESKLDLLLRNADSSWPIPPSTDCN